MMRLQQTGNPGDNSHSEGSSADSPRGVHGSIVGASALSRPSGLGRHCDDQPAQFPYPMSDAGATADPSRPYLDLAMLADKSVPDSISRSTQGVTRESADVSIPAVHPPAPIRPMNGVTDGRIRIPNVRTLIVDDCTLNRENMAVIFAVKGADIPTIAWDLPSLSAAVNRAAPDVVLLNMDTADGMTLLQSIRENSPHAKVIVVGISEDDESTIIACAEAGVTGYHLRNESLHDLILLISQVVNGESVCPPKVSAILLKRLSTLAAQRQPAAKELVLTAREIQILRMLELGLSNRDIADRLCIALHTVKNHVRSVLLKLGVRTRLEAAALARSRQPEQNSVEYPDSRAV
jgi:DNA-binding NarL/FixJ family response regulator